MKSIDNIEHSNENLEQVGHKEQLLSSDKSRYKTYLIGVLFKVLALSCFCLLSLGFEKTKDHSISGIVQFGIICIIGTLILLPITLIWFRKELQNASLKLYPIRALLSIAGMVSWIEAVKHFGSAPSILVNYLTPIVTLSLASFIGAERLRMQCLFIGLCCYGVILFTFKTSLMNAPYGLVMAILSSLFFALYEIICKKQTSKEHFIVQVFLTFLFAALFLLPISYEQAFETIINNNFGNYSLMALLRITNVILLFLAIKWATLNWLAPVSYTKFIIMAFWAFLLQGTIMKPEHFIAALIMIALNIMAMQLRRKSLSN